MNDLENEYVIDRQGTAWRAIDVFKIGETQGTRNERQRIIKLLEAWANCEHENHLPMVCSSPSYAHAIALIKGKQK